MQELASASSILFFSYRSPSADLPPDIYNLRFVGTGLERAGGQRILKRLEHHVTVTLGAAYPRMIPELHWRTPIFHPNISASGVVCLGGYSTHWAPSLKLDQLCVMLWDMIRYANFDVDSPYNRDAAGWARVQQDLPLPLDGRPLRDLQPDVAPARAEARSGARRAADVEFVARSTGAAARSPVDTVAPEIVEAEVVHTEPDILFID